MVYEAAKQSIQSVLQEIGELPELRETVDALNNPGLESALGEKPILYIGKTYLHYLRLIKDLAQLSPPEVNLIARANNICVENGISTNSAATGGADSLLAIIGPDNQKSLLKFALNSAQPHSPVFQAALKDLSVRMTGAQHMSQDELADGKSKKADYLIWGYRKGLRPKAMIHSTMSHFLNRTLAAVFTGSDDQSIREFTAHKDFFVNALGDMIRLLAAKGTVDQEIFDIWRLPRDQGGLGWNKDSKQEVFNQVVKSVK